MRVQELMFDSMFIQNRTIDKDRDFEATDIIEAGNNVTFLTDINHTKHINRGDVIIKSGTTVNMTAGNSIVLKSGFHVEAGANFHAYIVRIKNKQEFLTDIIILTIYMAQCYSLTLLLSAPMHKDTTL